MARRPKIFFFGGFATNRRAQATCQIEGYLKANAGLGPLWRHRMRTRTLRTTVLLAVLALTPALASARIWSESGDRDAAEVTAHAGFWESLLNRITAIWAAEGGTTIPGG